MGYTHYWSGHLNSSTSSQLTTDIHKLLSITSTKITGPAGTGDPQISPSSINLNGDESADQAHESLNLPIGQTISFGFCKTARKPYDEVVGAVLLRCLVYNQSTFTVWSDGCWEEWGDARVLYQTAFGVEAMMPEGLTLSWS
ncbi:hypothetical protein TWF281_008235 [Arthrobotrys megalospora]